MLPAIATLAIGVALLLPLRARSKSPGRPGPDTFAAALTAAVDLAPQPTDGAARVDVASADSVAVTRDHTSGNNHPAADKDFDGDYQPDGDCHLVQGAARITAFEIGVEPVRSGRRSDDEQFAYASGSHNPRPRPERKVPLTRLPLRRHTDAVGWPLLLEGRNQGCDRDARHHLLAEFARAGDVPDVAVLIAAYREEDAAGRALALRGLKLHTSSDVRAIFEEALRDGSDDERAAAVEALALCGPRESLVAALSDGVDAIAARAALGYVGSRERADYHLALTPFVDSARIDGLLSLLAGYLE